MKLKKINHELIQLIGNINSYRDIFLNKKLAQLGDIFVNFIYSISLSIVLKKLSGKKVSGKILMQALRDSKLNNYIPSRLSVHDIADAVEAIIFYTWLVEKMDMNEMINILIEELSYGDFSKKRYEIDISIIAFTKLLDKISELNILNKNL